MNLKTMDWKHVRSEVMDSGDYARTPRGNGLGLLTCQLVSGRPEICIRNPVRRGRGTALRSGGPGKASLRRGPRAN